VLGTTDYVRFRMLSLELLLLHSHGVSLAPALHPVHWDWRFICAIQSPYPESHSEGMRSRIAELAYLILE